MILDTYRQFPPDIRVEKEIAALCSAGHRVTVLTRRLPETAPLKENLHGNNASVARVPLEDNRRNAFKLLDRIRLLSSPWFEPLARFIEANKPDVLHVHDFLMVPTVLQVAEQFGLPVVADLHENMPAAMRAYRVSFPFHQKLKYAILYNYHLMRWHEARYLKRCAKVIVVVPEAAKRLYNYGLRQDQVVVVSNTEDETTFFFRAEDADLLIMERYKPYWTVSYVGGIGPHRGLDTTLQAIPLIRDQIPNLRLLIVGAGKQDRSQILSEICNLGIGDIVEVIGWQPFHKVKSYVLASDVCLVPHNNFEHTQTTVPHKLFQYMICKKPVLVSSCKPLARIVKQTGSGLVFEANDCQNLADKLLYMYQHPEQLIEMGLHGQQAALGEYAWRHDAQRLIQLYSSPIFRM